MKAISLIQPWATLVVIGAKKIETRSWNTSHRGEILIHASKKMTGEYKRLCQEEPFKTSLKDVDELPLGRIIGKVNILGTASTDAFGLMSTGIPLKKTYSKKDWDIELAFGDYSPGRFGWLLSDPVSFTNHYPINGSMSLWNFDERICLKCGCTDDDCRACIKKTGEPCYWIGDNLCSACG